jgi:hypothetical protein
MTSTISIAAAPTGTYNKIKRLLGSVLGSHDAYSYAKAPDSLFSFDADADQAVTLKEQVGEIEGAEITLAEPAAAEPAAVPEPEPAAPAAPAAPAPAPAAASADLPPYPPALRPGMTLAEVHANREQLAAAIAARQR